jgi:membrane-associated phospholipid phosphatase
LLAALPFRSIVGQTALVDDSVHAAKTLFTWRDGVLAAGFAGLTVAMFPADRALARRVRDSAFQNSPLLKPASRAIAYVAAPGSIIIGVSLYTVGRVTRLREVQDLGLHGTEAIIFSGALTGVLKGLAGRARPFVSLDTNPSDFRLGRGITRGAYQSFPSGHTTLAFAAASVVTSESQRWWSHGIWIVAPLMYGGATLVGISRMFNDAHWASDVVLGAGVGTFSGIKVVRYTHGHSKNLIDRWLLSAEVVPLPDGTAGVGWKLAY